MPTTSRRPSPDSLTAYLSAIGSYAILTRNEERELARRVRDGDAAACERLVCANLRFVVSVAKRYQHLGLALGDLINEGNLGLLRAAARFDEAKGTKFITYAVWFIRQAIVQAIGDTGQAVRVPREHVNAQCFRDLQRSVSLNAPARGNEHHKPLMELVADETSDAPGAQLTVDGLTERAASALDALDPRQARVLRLYFGIGSDAPMTLDEIAVLLGVSRERTRQIKDAALQRIRQGCHAAALESFWE